MHQTSKYLENINYGNASSNFVDGCLVLEGGAFRGLYASGVLDTFMMKDLNFNCIISVSAGALNGVNYVSGQIGRSAYINLKYRHDSRYVGLKAIKNNSGIIGFDFAFDTVNEEYPFNQARFKDPRQRFVVVATNLITGEPTYFEKGNKDNIFEAVRASASMPYVSKPVYINDIPYLDGGCSDKIPFQWALNQGFKNIVVVRTRPVSYHKGDKSILEKTSSVYKKYPAFQKALASTDRRYDQACDQLEKLHKEKRIFMIAPSQPISIKRLEGNIDKLENLYHLGQEDATSALPELYTYLKRP